MKWFPWAVLFFIMLFLFQGYKFANYQNLIWTFVYSIWDKIKDLILVLLIIFLLKKIYESRELRVAYVVCSVFLMCRIIWELIAIKFHLSINDRLAIRYLFYVCWVLIMVIFLFPYLRRLFWIIGIWLSAFIMTFKRKHRV